MRLGRVSETCAGISSQGDPNGLAGDQTQRGNAGVVPLSTGTIFVKVNQGGGSVQFVVDVNGYYSDTFSDPSRVRT